MKIIIEGSAGSGKSTIALEIKRMLEDRFPNWDVDLLNPEYIGADYWEGNQDLRLDQLAQRKEVVDIEEVQSGRVPRR